MKCRDCKFVKMDGGLQEPHGVCRRFPPTALAPNQATFPIVHLDTFDCGEFVKREPVKQPTKKRSSRNV